MKLCNISMLSMFMTLMLTSIAIEVKGVIAYPYPIECQQPDGSHVTVQMFGDEYLNWAQTQDGYSLLFDENGFLVYAIEDSNGDMVASKIKAGDLGKDTSNSRLGKEGIRKNLGFSSAQIHKAKEIRRANVRESFRERDNHTPEGFRIKKSQASPIVGEYRMIVILVEYEDIKFSHSMEDFDMLMNGTDYFDKGNRGSVRDYYKENSFGKLDVISDVVGVYTLPHPRSYYAKDRYREMALDAVNLADQDINFNDYFNNDSETLDNIHIIFAGAGKEAGGGDNCVWSHSSYLDVKCDGRPLGRYSCSPEIRGAGGSGMSYIGVICHEIGHVLGCMDFYDTDYSFGGQYQGLDRWDIMSSGNWNAQGASPAHFNPYVKIYDFGWGNAIEADSPSTITLKSKDENGFLRIDTDDDGDYFLLEYRSLSGFDYELPGHGLLVYHAVKDLKDYARNTINATFPQQFHIVSANSEYISPYDSPFSYGDVNMASTPFPGTLNKTELTDLTIPSMLNFNGVPTNCPLTEIAEDVANESVTFNVDGGEYGGCSYFKAEESDLSSISLAWRNPNGYKVMIAASAYNEIGNPLTPDCRPGDATSADGEIVYVGSGSFFIHKGLEEGQTVYYKLMTQIEGVWVAPKSIKAKTEIGVIRKFPYLEDFEKGKLDQAWTQEMIASEETWVIDHNDYDSNHKLFFRILDDLDSDSIVILEKKENRIISPKIDFTSSRKALLSFDCLNTLRPLKLMYRVSENDNWIPLSVVDTDYKSGMGLDSFRELDNEYTRKYHVLLKDLSSSYQISFVADYEKIGMTISMFEMVAIDNVQIVTDFAARVISYPCEIIGQNYAKTKIDVIEGLHSVIEAGVEWSQDGSNWIRQPSEDRHICMLYDLPENTNIHYHAYAVLNDGSELCGDEMKLSTISFFKNGNGSSEDPFLLTDTKDWNNFLAIIEKGIDCTGLCFRFAKTIEVDGGSYKPSGIFNGSLDGAGYTLVMASDTHKWFLNEIGPKGSVRNLNIRCLQLIGERWGSAILCNRNSGKILSCNLEISNLLVYGNGQFGGFAYHNYGQIIDCHSVIDVDCSNAAENSLSFGGICYINNSFINGCSFSGTARGNSHSTIGGIASLSYDKILQNRQVSAVIRNCVNYADLGVAVSEENPVGRSNDIGGIAGSNCGLVDQCVNYGNISNASGTDQSSASSVGGILGLNNRGVVQNCSNKGEVSSTWPFDFQASGGIAGRDYIGFVDKCVDHNTFNMNEDRREFINAIVGRTCETAITNCYYTGYISDEYALEVHAEEYLDVVDELNAHVDHTWRVYENMPMLQWEIDGIIMGLDRIQYIGKDEALIQGSVHGKNVVECGLEWRKAGDVHWNYIPGSIGEISEWKLEDLLSKTRYEIRLTCEDVYGDTYHSSTEIFATLFSTEGTLADPHMIMNRDELMAFSEMVAHGTTFVGKIVRLMKDIDLMGYKGILWRPISSRIHSQGYFKGEFDGNGRVISNMKISGCDYVSGFFGTTGGYIHDLNIKDAEIYSSIMAAQDSPVGGIGGICGRVYRSDQFCSNIERCSFTGMITGGNKIGSISGQGINIKNCYAIADLATITEGYTKIIGGIAGSCDSVQDSYYVGEIRIKGNRAMINGICNKVSYWAGVVENCFYNSPIADKTGTRYMSLIDMKSDILLSHFSSDIWMRSFDVNDGFPAFKSSFDTRLSTLEAVMEENADISMHAMLVMGSGDAFHNKGFEWYNIESIGYEKNLNLVDSQSECYAFTVPNRKISENGIVFRALAYQGEDSVFGDWVKYVPKVKNPTLTFTIRNNSAEKSTLVDISIYSGTFEVQQLFFNYRQADTDDDPIVEEIHDGVSSLHIYGLKSDLTYEGWLFCVVKDQTVFEGEHQLFSVNQKLDGIETMFKDEEAVTVYNLQGVKMLDNMPVSYLQTLPPGLYVVKGRKVLICNDN